MEDGVKGEGDVVHRSTAQDLGSWAPDDGTKGNATGQSVNVRDCKTVFKDSRAGRTQGTER